MGGKWEVFLRSLWGFGVSLFRLSTHGMVPHQRRVSRLFQTVLGSWTPAKCAPIRAAQQAAAVKVEVGLAPSIHVVSCCFRLVMIAPGAWLKTCWRSWCYSGPGEAASLLGQLAVKGIEAVWKWEEEEATVCRIIMSCLTDICSHFCMLTFHLCELQEYTETLSPLEGSVLQVLWLFVVRSHLWDEPCVWFPLPSPALFIGRCRVKKFRLAVTLRCAPSIPAHLLASINWTRWRLSI